MRRCPTCRARMGAELVCRRCATSVHQIVAVERQAERLARQALADLSAGKLESAYQQATEARRLHRCETSLRAVALAALATRRLGQALASWAELCAGDLGQD